MQRILVKLALIRSKLHDILISVSERGTSVMELEARSDDLVESSSVFLIKTRPWYYPPPWWFRSGALKRCCGAVLCCGK